MRGFGFKIMSKKLNLIGQKFGRLTVIKFSHLNKWKTNYWICKCKCNKIVIISSSNLKSGYTKSCGCFRIEKMTKHGFCRTRFYTIWQGIKKRCFNPNSKRFSDYGGRGIIVCQRWLKFENFCDDMYKSYKEHCNKYSEKNTTIDRFPNNNGNYKLNNCRWATRKEQAINMRTNQFLTYKKQTLTISQWEQKLNFGKSIIRGRIKSGWSISKALTTPVKTRKK